MKLSSLLMLRLEEDAHSLASWQQPVNAAQSCAVGHRQ